MSRFFRNLILIIGFSSLLFSCEKDELTNEYCNVLIDTKYYESVALRPEDSRRWLQFNLSNDKKKAYIHAICNQRILISLILCDSVQFSKKIYYLNGGKSLGLLYTDLGDFSTDIYHTGSVEITTWNEKDSIIEGNFEYDAINTNFQLEMKIRSGKFRIAY